MKSILLSFIIVFCGCLTKAQTPQYSISGLVADSISGKNVEYVTINLKTDKDVVIKSVYTKEDGGFVFTNVNPGSYFLTVIALGYKSTNKIVNLKTNTDLGIIYINPQSSQLNTVSITADKPIIRMESDRIIYDLQADPESKGYSVLEMMRKVPMLSVDPQDNILLKGKASYKILINGKSSGIMDNSPTDILRSMAASTIQSIEVITSPPSKYDGEGLAGIINIITIKRQLNGYNGTLNLREAAPVNNSALSTNFNEKAGKFGLALVGGFNSNRRAVSSDVLTRQSFGTNANDVIVRANRSTFPRRKYIQTDLSYEIDSLNLISGQYNYGQNIGAVVVDASTTQNVQQAVVQSYNWQARGNVRMRTTETGLNYQLGFRKNKDEFLTFSFRYYTYINAQNNNYLTTNRFNYTQPDYRQESRNGPNEKTFQIDYIHPAKKLTIEGGLKAIYRNNTSDFTTLKLNSVSQQFEPDPTGTDKFSNDQSIYAAYNAYRYTNKDWDFRAGPRIEETVNNAEFIGGTYKVEQNYFNILPSVSMSTKFKDESSINFSFTQRIQRPGIRNLNPFVDKLIGGFESSGNPDLQAVVSNNLQMGYNRSKKMSLNISFSYDFVNNGEQFVSIFNPATNITRNTFMNTGKDKRLNGNLSIGYPFGKKWNMNLNVEADYVMLEGSVDGKQIKRNGVQCHPDAGLSYKPWGGWRINGNVDYYTAGIDLQGGPGKFFGYSFSVNKDIVKDRLSFSASSECPFNKYRNFSDTISGNNFLQKMVNHYNYRTISASLNYKFGKLKEALKKNKRGISNDDVVGG